jgi:hypothetical protein
MSAANKRAVSMFKGIYAILTLLFTAGKELMRILHKEILQLRELKQVLALLGLIERDYRFYLFLVISGTSFQLFLMT